MCTALLKYVFFILYLYVLRYFFSYSLCIDFYFRSFYAQKKAEIRHLIPAFSIPENAADSEDDLDDNDSDSQYEDKCDGDYISN